MSPKRLTMATIALFSAFKQKTAYEIRIRLVGSEMCIRDSTHTHTYTHTHTHTHKDTLSLIHI